MGNLTKYLIRPKFVLLHQFDKSFLAKQPTEINSKPNTKKLMPGGTVASRAHMLKIFVVC